MTTTLFYNKAKLTDYYNDPEHAVSTEKQESPAAADKPRDAWNPGNGSLKSIESDTMR